MNFYIQDLCSNSFLPLSFNTDVVMYDDHYDYICNLPGFQKEDISVNYDNSRLNVSAAHKEIKTEGTRITKEINSSYKRSFLLKSDSNMENAKTTYVNGQLIITIPRIENPTKKLLIE